MKREIEPFCMIPRWVLQAEISPGAVRTYGMLQDMAGKEKPAFPSHRYLANLCRCSRASVKRYINELIEIGAIKVEHRTRENDPGQSSNLYWVMHNRPNLSYPPFIGELGAESVDELHNNNQIEPELNKSESKKHLQVARDNLKKGRRKHDS